MGSICSFTSFSRLNYAYKKVKHHVLTTCQLLYSVAYGIFRLLFLFHLAFFTWKQIWHNFRIGLKEVNKLLNAAISVYFINYQATMYYFFKYIIYIITNYTLFFVITHLILKFVSHFDRSNSLNPHALHY